MVTGGLGALLVIPAGILFGLILLIPSVIAAIKVFSDQEYSYPITAATLKTVKLGGQEVYAIRLVPELDNRVVCLEIFRLNLVFPHPYVLDFRR